MPSFLCSPFNFTLVVSADHSMSQFLSNLPFPLRSRFSRGPGTASSGQPLVPSSSLAMVPTSTTVVNPPSYELSLLAHVPSHGHSVNKDSVTSVEPFEPTPQMDKGKQPTKEGFQPKRKRAMSIESDKSIPREGLMTNSRRAGREEEFFKIKLSADSTGRLADVENRCRQPPLCHCLPVQWLNECLS